MGLVHRGSELGVRSLTSDRVWTSPTVNDTQLRPPSDGCTRLDVLRGSDPCPKRCSTSRGGASTFFCRATERLVPQVNLLTECSRHPAQHPESRWQSTRSSAIVSRCERPRTLEQLPPLTDHPQQEPAPRSPRSVHRLCGSGTSRRRVQTSRAPLSRVPPALRQRSGPHRSRAAVAG